LLRGFFVLSTKAKPLGRHRRRERSQHVAVLRRDKYKQKKRASAREGEDHKITFAGQDDAEKAAIGGDGELAKREAMQNWLRSWLDDGDVFAGGLRQQRRNINPDNVAGFPFCGALEEDAIFVGSPVENAETYAEADKMIGNGKVAHFENFAVDEVGDFFAAGRNGQAAGVTIECGDFLVILREEFEALEPRRPGHGVVAFDGDGGVGAGNAIGVDKRAALKSGTGGASRDIGVAEGKKHARLNGLGEVDDGGVVLEPGGVEAVLDGALAFAEADFFAVVFESEGHEGVFGAAGFVDDGGGEELGEDEATVGRPMEGVADVGKRLIAAIKFVALEQAAALAIEFLNPDVVVLEIVLFGLEVAADGIDDATVRCKREGGDLVVDVLERLIEVLAA